MTTSYDLLVLVYEALTTSPDTTDAGPRVFKPGDWPTQQDQYPIIRLRIANEDRQSLGRSGAPEFTTIATIQALGEVSADAEAGNAGAGAAEAALWALKRQLEIAVINSYPLMTEIQQFPSIRSTLNYDSTGSSHLASVQIDLALEFYEGPENFAPVEADPLTSISLSDTNLTPAPGFIADLPQ